MTSTASSVAVNHRVIGFAQAQATAVSAGAVDLVLAEFDQSFIQVRPDDILSDFEFCTPKYPPLGGDCLLRDVVAQEHGVDPRRVVVTPGGTGALMLALQSVTKPSDSVAMTTPTYGPTLKAAKSRGLHVVLIPSLPPDGSTGRWTLDIEALDRAVAQGIRAFIIADPDNPTGRVLAIEERDAIFKITEARGVWLIYDRVYGSFGLFASPAEPPVGDRVLIVDSVSKRLQAPGLRVGWLIASLDAANRFIDVVDWTNSGVPVALQRLAARGLQNFTKEQEESRLRQLRSAHRIISESLRGAGLPPWPVEGGLFVCVPTEAFGTPDDVEAWERLLCAGIGGLPSRSLGLAAGSPNSFVRLSFARSLEVLAAAQQALLHAAEIHVFQRV